MSDIVVTLPIYWQRTKKTVDLLSLNNYRNWHYFTSNKFKEVFTGLSQEQFQGFTAIEGQYKVHSKLYYKRANCDASNIIPVVEKVVLDSLVAAGLLPGDSVKHHVSASWEVEKDADNPRCVTTITKTGK